LLTEAPGSLPNWVAAAGIMEAALTSNFSEKVADLRETDPLVDWSKMDKGQNEARRVLPIARPLRRGRRCAPAPKRKTPPLGEHVAGRPSDVCGASFFFDVEPMTSWRVAVEECGFDRKGRVQCDRPFKEPRLCMPAMQNHNGRGGEDCAAGR
jgi:hypothetical protein